MLDSIPGLAAVPVIGILRRCPPAHVSEVAETAAEAGLRVVEVTMDSDGPLDQIRTVSAARPELTVGIGSVLDAGAARAAIDAGARFVVTPIVDDATITTCVGEGIPVVPGAATPSEIHRARLLGATAVKVFPAAQLGGPPYVRAIRGPLGDPPMVPTGGVGADDLREYLDAGAVAVGAGGALFPRAALESGDVVEIARRAAAWVAASR